jgi:serine phosphatase RsbU (regulator of sigma subunit)
MQSSFSVRQALRHILAFVFALLATAYSVLWIVHVRHPRPQPGFSEYRYSAANRSMTVGSVYPESPAWRAGLRPGDKIVEINGQRLENLRPFYYAIIIDPGDVVEITVQDTSSPAGLRQVHLVLRGPSAPPRTKGFDIWRINSELEQLLNLPMGYYPVGFLLVGIGVLLLRPDDRNAWLLALIFGGFASGGPLFEGSIPVQLRGFTVAYKMIMVWTSAALFYYFFAVFPAPSALDRKLPWLKHVLLATAVIATVPMGLLCLVGGGSLPLYLHRHWPGATSLTWALTGQTGLPVPGSSHWPPPEFVFFGGFFVATVLGLASLIANNLSPDAQIRRKAHVMLWGTAVGITPVALAVGAATLRGPGFVPIVVWQATILLMCLVWPLSFGYAVVKHRVLEIPVLLKRSARYLIVKMGYLLITLALPTGLAIWLFVTAFTRLFRVPSQLALPVGFALGVILGAISARVNLYFRPKVMQKIDRAFFRSVYDIQQVLENLAQKSRKATAREQLASLLRSEIIQALHPVAIAVYFQTTGGQLMLQADGPNSRCASAVSAVAPVLQELARRAEPYDVPSVSGPNHDDSVFGALQAECLVPLVAGDGHLTGVLALGSRLSEEPYSREDKRLLASVANQASLALESIRLGEDIAEHIEVERKAARDMEIAKQVQARLFPQKLPALRSLEYSGRCIQAREVGGDYYDFLSLGQGRMGIVLADIVGKGIPGALLMANLQADVRSQSAIAAQNLPQFLKSVNQSFYESTDIGSYATLFFGDYDDAGRRMRFANCGHNPPFLVRASKAVERLSATATVLGLFENWDSSICEVEIAAGDVLVFYTDGITEATNSVDEEFGEKRLLETICANVHLAPSLLLDAIVAATLAFSGSELRDDLTLVVARGR